MEQAIISPRTTSVSFINEIAKPCAGPDDIPVTCNMCWVSARHQRLATVVNPAKKPRYYHGIGYPAITGKGNATGLFGRGPGILQ